MTSIDMCKYARAFLTLIILAKGTVIWILYYIQPSRKVIIIIFAVNYFLPLFVASVQFAIKWWAWTNSFYIGNSYNWSSYGFDHLLYWANALWAFQTQKKSDRKHSTSCKFFFNRKKGYGTSWSVKNYTKYVGISKVNVPGKSSQSKFLRLTAFNPPIHK